MFPSLSGSKQRNPYKFGTTPESRLAAMTWREEQQRADLRKEWNAKVEMTRKPLRSAIGHSIQDSNAYVQLFRSREGDAAAAEQLLKNYNPRRNCIDLVGLVPECARAISKYEKVLQVMEDEDREFDEQYKTKILEQKFTTLNTMRKNTAPSATGQRMIEEEKKLFEEKKKRVRTISKGNQNTDRDSKKNNVYRTSY